MWRILQLADAAFPCGGFAHSAGLEACAQFAPDVAFPDALDAVLWQTGRLQLPFVREAARAPERIDELSELSDAVLSNHVANRASRAQARQFVATCVRVYESDALRTLAQTGGALHFAPAFGATAALLGLGPSDAQRLFLHQALRGASSAGIRLGRIGPFEAQRIASERHPLLDRIMNECKDLSIDDVAQPAPFFEVYAALHDKLYSRLFQS